MRVISIVNQKGGVGKTATAVNLAYSLSSRNYKVCLIDFDPQANCTKHFGFRSVSRMPTIYDFLMFPEKKGSSSLKDVAISKYGITLIPADESLASARSEHAASKKVLRNTLKNCEELNEYDYVIVDSAPQPGFLTDNALIAGDNVLIPMQCKYLSVEGLASTMESLKSLKENLSGINTEIMGILPTFYDSRRNDDNDSLDKIKRFFYKMTLDPIRENTAVSLASKRHVPIQMYESDSYAAKDYERLGDFVENRLS